MRRELAKSQESQHQLAELQEAHMMVQEEIRKVVDSNRHLMKCKETMKDQEKVNHQTTLERRSLNPNPNPNPNPQPLR